MKLVIAIALAAMSTVTLAASHKTLEQYDASYAYTVQWPVIGFSAAQVPVKNVCIDGDTFKTINDVKVCTKQAVVEVCTTQGKEQNESCRAVRRGETPKEGPRTRLVYGCVASERQALSVSQFYEEKVCTKWKRNYVGGKERDGLSWTCLAYDTVTKERADNYDVSVLRNGHGDHNDIEVANINFELPACK